jgi:hypothetical protein
MSVLAVAHLSGAYKNLVTKNAWGIDLEAESDYVGLADINHLDKDSFSDLDHIFSNWSIFSYQEDKWMQTESLEKMAAWLKPGGKIYLAPIFRPCELESLVASVPELKISEMRQKGSYTDSTAQSFDTHYAILKKKK